MTSGQRKTGRAVLRESDDRRRGVERGSDLRRSGAAREDHDHRDEKDPDDERSLRERFLDGAPPGVDRVLAESVDPPRFVMLLMTAFAALALVLQLDPCM